MQAHDFDSAEFREKYHYDGVLGVEFTEDEAIFRLWAPTASWVQLYIYPDGDDSVPQGAYLMNLTDHGVWQIHLPKGKAVNRYYDYDVTVDGKTRRTQDPYAKSAGLNGKRSMALDLDATDPDGWENDRSPKKPDETIIYELHVKDYSADPNGGFPEEYRGKYMAFCCENTKYRDMPTGLEYMRELGVTHIELMPVYDFATVDEANPSAFNWGYDPQNYNVPDGSYSTDPCKGETRVRELKSAVMSLHKAGFRVIMDVVYNHTYSFDTPLFATVPWYFYRRHPNGKTGNASGCGNEIASERSMCSRYIVDSVMYWAEEYHIDGFRFDLMGVIDAETMNKARDALAERFGQGEKLLFGEPWSAEMPCPQENVPMANKDNLYMMKTVGAFCDVTRDAIKGDVGSEQSRGFVNGGGLDLTALTGCLMAWCGKDGAAGNYVPCQYRASTAAQIITYVSAHDDHTLWDKLVITLTPERGFGTDNREVLRANKLAAAIYMSCQGRLFMLAGEEFGRTKLGHRNTYNARIELNRIDWNRACEQRELVEYYKGLIELRKQLPALCDKGPNAYKRFTEIKAFDSGFALARVDNGTGSGNWKELLIYFNVNTERRTAILPEGDWDVLLSGESSTLWKNGTRVSGSAELAPVTALILGKRV